VSQIVLIKLVVMTAVKEVAAVVMVLMPVSRANVCVSHNVLKKSVVQMNAVDIAGLVPDRMIVLMEAASANLTVT
jgi:hypothetical protein